MTKYKFPKSTIQEIHTKMEKYTLRSERTEVAMPLCVDDKNKISLGDELVIGTKAGSNFPKGKCKDLKYAGSVHTHPQELKYPQFMEEHPELKERYKVKDAEKDYVELFPELDYLSEGDVWGVVTGLAREEIPAPYMSCAYEKDLQLESETREVYSFVCENYQDVKREDLEKVVRIGYPSKERVDKIDNIKKQLLYAAIKDYPFKEKLPKSVIDGQTIRYEDLAEKEKKQIKEQGKNMGYDIEEFAGIYPSPLLQRQKDWRKAWFYEDIREEIPQEFVQLAIQILVKNGPEALADIGLAYKSYMEFRSEIWRKADGASIKKHLSKEGKLKTDGNAIICKKVKIGRAGREKTIKSCNFKDIELEL